MTWGWLIGISVGVAINMAVIKLFDSDRARVSAWVVVIFLCLLVLCIAR